MAPPEVTITILVSAGGVAAKSRGSGSKEGIVDACVPVTCAGWQALRWKKYLRIVTLAVRTNRKGSDRRHDENLGGTLYDMARLECIVAHMDNSGGDLK